MVLEVVVCEGGICMLDVVELFCLVLLCVGGLVGGVYIESDL